MNPQHQEFIVDSREHLNVFERSLLALEKTSGQSETQRLIEESLRAVHSLKGNAGFLGYTTIRNLAHAMESLIEDYRDGSTIPSPEVIEALLIARDRLSAIVEDLEHSSSADISEMLSRLSSLQGLRGATLPGHEPDPAYEIHIDVDLGDWFDRHTGNSMVHWLRSLNSAGEFVNGQLMENLGNWMDSGQWPEIFQAHLTGRLLTKVGPDQIATLVGQGNRSGDSLPDSCWQTKSVDLSQRFANSGDSLVQIFRTLELEQRSRNHHLQFTISDLNQSLPVDPVLWHADVEVPHASLKNSEAVQRSEPKSSDQEDLEKVSRSSSTIEMSDQRSDTQFAQAHATHAPTAPVTTVPVTTVPVTAAQQPAVKAPIAEETASSNAPSQERGIDYAKRVAAIQEPERIRSLRINVELLDRLMSLTGELTLVRNQTLVTFAAEEGESRNIIQRLSSITTEMQDAVLQTRMQPVGNLFGRFPRMVRDLARQLGKEVEVVTIGQDVELDKTVLERLSDPLTHLIRNSIDHGIELPDDRIALGKPRTGKIILSAAPADGQVHIEIRDDGRGIDPVAVRAKALAMGLRTEAELQRMGNRDLYSLIMLPGFSTAKQVTDVSGRGVGMDVVKTNVDELEGHLTIDSWLNAGTSMVLRVPLTLAIVPCLIVSVGESRFAVPQRELEEIVCLHPGSNWALEHAYDTEVIRLRDNLLPVVRFSEVLARQKPFSGLDKADILSKYALEDRDPRTIEYILILRTLGKRFGLLVDGVQGREEIVVKPMHPALKQLSVFAGATLMGDGRATLIANVEGIIDHSRCFAIASDDSSRPSLRDPNEVHRVLLFEYGTDEQFALPLIQVRRVEMIDMRQVEKVGHHAYIRIDGKSTRILRLNELLEVSPCQEETQMFLILPKFVPEPMGLLARRIVDTDSLANELQPLATERGILGTAFMRERLTLFLDVQQFRELVFGGSETTAGHSNKGSIFNKPQTENASKDRDVRTRQNGEKAVTRQRVLLVDDTPFFREVVKRYLTSDATEIETAIDGKQALEIMSRSNFDLVVSDIEMPVMDGWQFCRSAREKGYRMPIVALTSLARGDYENRARECGFDDFEEKLDHDRLKQMVNHWLTHSREKGNQR